MKYKVTLNDTVYEVEVEKGDAILLDEYKIVAAPSAPNSEAAIPAPAPAADAAPVPAASGTALAQGDVVESPMPGTILDIKVQVGMQVKEGDTLVILEAMKMENEIKAARNASVVQIVVNQGATIDTGAPLLVLR
jgi:biotin carboxyl carrier protein